MLPRFPHCEQLMDHPIAVVSIMLYGDPRSDEPFWRAWQRTLDRLGLAAEPDDMLIDRLRARVIQGLPGRNEAEKITMALSEGPPWLKERAQCDAIAVDDGDDAAEVPPRPETYVQ